MNQQVNLSLTNLDYIANKKIHFIAIGGIGVSALARYLHFLKFPISGSDKENSRLIEALISEGIQNIWTPQNKFNLQKINPDIIVYSTAITDENEEFIWSKENKKILLHRSELLEQIISTKKVIAISGTHGKTTTTSMASEVFIANNLDPSVFVGGILINKNTNVLCGYGNHFIVEADESDKSFLKCNPDIAVVTNIEPDHLENYSNNFEEIKTAFKTFMNKGLANTGLIACFNDLYTKEIVQQITSVENKKLISYSLEDSLGQNLYNAKLIGIKNKENRNVDVYFQNKYLISFKPSAVGDYNILNALSLFGISILYNLNLEKTKLGIENFQGVKRRFQTIYNGQYKVVDDYAHHPTEIKETIKAALDLGYRRVIVILQPHNPIRIKNLWNDFISALKDFNCMIFITDIYVARGENIINISSKNLVNEINRDNIKYLEGTLNDIAKQVKLLIQDNDLVITMGAGSITQLGELLVK